jgi:CRISPR/Cas system-associated exonuclease Cas4 (RecB family)
MENDALLIPGHRVERPENWQNASLPDLGVHLTGRLDRLTSAPDETVTVIDYKKGKLATQKDQHGGSADAIGLDGLEPELAAADRDSIRSVQIPLYVWLLQSKGREVGAAAYYSLENGEALPVIGGEELRKNVMTSERLQEVVAQVREKIRLMVEDIRSGDYSCRDACEGCGLRSVCRTRFVVQ